MKAILTLSHLSVGTLHRVLYWLFSCTRPWLQDVLVAIDLSRKTFDRIRLNYFYAMAYNVVMIPFAAGIFFPCTHMQARTHTHTHARERVSASCERLCLGFRKLCCGICF